MENNDYIEETQNEETQEAVTDTEQTEQNSAEDTRDWKAEALKYKAIAERKDKKLQEQPKEADNKLNTNETLTREETIFFAKGGNEEDLDFLKKIKGDRTLKEAQESEEYLFYKQGREAKEKAEKAQLGASNSNPIGSPKREKDPAEMSDKELKAYHQKLVEEALK